MPSMTQQYRGGYIIIEHEDCGGIQRVTRCVYFGTLLGIEIRAPFNASTYTAAEAMRKMHEWVDEQLDNRNASRASTRRHTLH